MENIKKHEEEDVSLVEVFEVLWSGKVKIMLITTLSAIIGIIAAVMTPTTHVLKASITSTPLEFRGTFRPLSSLLRDAGQNFDWSGQELLNKFVKEFSDYGEVREIIETSAFVKKAVEGLPQLEKQNAMRVFTQSVGLELSPSSDEKKWVVSIEWHDPEKGRQILGQILAKVAVNLQKSLVMNIENIVKSVADQNQRAIDRVNLKMLGLKARVERQVLKRLSFLEGQATIARALNIKRHSPPTADPLGGKTPNFSLSLYSDDSPYYLRGFEAIEKEIRLLSNLSTEKQMLLFSDTAYMTLSDQLFAYQNDLSPAQIRAALKLLKSISPENYVSHDLGLAISQTRSMSRIYVGWSFIVGGLIGCVYVLLLDVFRKRRVERKTVES